MRATLVLPDPVCDRAREAARAAGCTLSQYVARALAVLMSREDDARAPGRTPFRVEPERLGVPRVDVANREQLDRGMEE